MYNKTYVKQSIESMQVLFEMQRTIENICEAIASNPNPSIVLLRRKEVIQWLFGDLSFLPEIVKKNKTADEKIYKVHEDKWGQDMLKVRRPDLKLDKQWTNKFGEHLCEEIFTLKGKSVQNLQISSIINQILRWMMLYWKPRRKHFIHLELQEKKY